MCRSFLNTGGHGRVVALGKDGEVGVRLAGPALSFSRAAMASTFQFESILFCCRQDLLGSALPNPRWHAPQSTGDGTKNSTGDGIGGGRGVVVIERPRRAELQRAAQLAVDRMAAKRNFPQVGSLTQGHEVCLQLAGCFETWGRTCCSVCRGC